MPVIRSLLALSLVVGCDDDPAPAPPPVFAATVVVDDLEPIVLSAWGAAPDDVYFAGGTLAADGRYLAHFDGTRVRPLDPPDGGALWWVFGTDASHIWACGDRGGLVALRDGAWVEESVPLDDKAVLWGVWASSPTDLWAVGGSFRPSGPKGVLLRSDGDGTWERVEDPALPSDTNLYKVWGSGPEDVHIVGELGVALHYDGRSFTRVDTDVTNLLFTVHGFPGGPVVAVGGLSEGAVLEWRDGAWEDTGVSGVSGLAGVYVRRDGSALAVGNAGAVVQRDPSGAWRVAESTVDLESTRTLHAVWGEAATWVVGGDLQRQSRGVIATSVDPTPGYRP